jgi:hypothetical protein
MFVGADHESALDREVADDFSARGIDARNRVRL